MNRSESGDRPGRMPCRGPTRMMYSGYALRRQAAALATAAMVELAMATVRAALPMMPVGETMANAAKATTAWATAVVTAHRTARAIKRAGRGSKTTRRAGD